MQPEEKLGLVAKCRLSPDIFCSSIEKYEDRTSRPKTAVRKPNTGRRGSARLRFSRQGKLQNWADVREASLGSLIRSFARLNDRRLSEVFRNVLSETECAPNPSIALAVALEDALPQRSTFDEIGRLYERAGKCITDAPVEREQLLTRGGLFYFANGDYVRASALLEESSRLETTFTARALFWLAKAQEKLKQPERAKKSIEELRAKYPFSFHTLIALTSSGKDPGEILKRNAKPSVRRSANIPEVNSVIEQAETLQKFGFEESASRVLDWAIADAPTVEPEVKLYLAELKKEQRDYPAKISLLTDVLYEHPELVSGDTMELYFPKVYFPIFETQSSKIDPFLLLAIARRESAFNPRALSGAKARGLLQILPSTSRKVSRRKADLFDPYQNVEVGAKYVLELLRRTDGQIHLALASYNAGPGKVAAWTKRYPSEPILFVDLIPYRETREYVASVIRNYYWYRRIHLGTESLNEQSLLARGILPLENQNLAK